MIFSDKITALAAQAEKELSGIYRDIDELSFFNTSRIMDAFSEYRVSSTMFDGTSGYGYDDRGEKRLI